MGIRWGFRGGSEGVPRGFRTVFEGVPWGFQGVPGGSAQRKPHESSASANVVQPLKLVVRVGFHRVCDTAFTCIRGVCA